MIKATAFTFDLASGVEMAGRRIGTRVIDWVKLSNAVGETQKEAFRVFRTAYDQAAHKYLPFCISIKIIVALNFRCIFFSAKKTPVKQVI